MNAVLVLRVGGQKRIHTLTRGVAQWPATEVIDFFDYRHGFLFDIFITHVQELTWIRLVAGL